MSITDWAGLFENCTTVDDTCQKITEKYLSLSKSCITTKLVTISPSDKIWMNSDIRKQLDVEIDYISVLVVQMLIR